MIGSPFQQQGNTVMFTAAASPPTAVQAAASNSAGPQQYMLTNLGANPAFIGYSFNSAAEALTRAVIPTGGGANGKWGLWILPLSQVTISGPPNAFFTGITASGTSDIHIAPGEGV